VSLADNTTIWVLPWLAKEIGQRVKASPFKVESLAKAAGISREHLARIHLGITPRTSILTLKKICSVLAYPESEVGSLLSRIESEEAHFGPTAAQDAYWKKLVGKSYSLPILSEDGIALVSNWNFLDGDRVKLRYEPERRLYGQNMPDQVRYVFDHSIKKNDNELRKFMGEPEGKRLRIESIQLAAQEKGYPYVIVLSPTVYLYYEAVHHYLSDYPRLRRDVFDNAVGFVTKNETPILPSTFAYHTLVISKDKRFIARYRTGTALWPEHWEASMGEFVHGPKDNEFQRFKHGKKEQTLRECIEEGKTDERARIGGAVERYVALGMAVEHYTLSPKLMVLVFSEAPAAKLAEGFKKSVEGAGPVADFELSPKGVAEAIFGPEYPDWTPESKLAILGALAFEKNDSQFQDTADELKAEIGKVKTGRGVSRS